ncbi:MAG TPA: S46 family peptidase [Chitinophagaceae bacterium]|nr:S46 family peptidase [Chitinophagaceae bacterium]
MKFMKHLLVAASLLFFSCFAKADEGMWLPQLLAQLNEKQMKSMGMKITASDIYNINKGSLKDAIVSFGGFCTGEVVSSRGLLLTNHHCGFDVIQDHSTLEHNYIRDGFWSRNTGEEIPHQGLFVTFIVRIDDVTKEVLNGTHPKMEEKERQSIVDKNIAELRKNVKKESYQDTYVRAFFEGNHYYLFVTETYKDVRLVGAPPSAVGNFGKDTDNWMWPRHTGDFSMFRIYAGKDNKPADYSTDNIPYTPKRSLSISLDGVSDGDFTMVFGFPGRTTEYLHSSAVEQIMTVNDPAKIAIRDKALTVIDGFMRKDEQIKIMYAAKYAGIQNSYKKWQGEVLGLTSTNAVAKKKVYEAEFQKRVMANPQWNEKYGLLLTTLQELYNKFLPYGKARDFFNEIIGRIELFTIAAQLNSLVTAFQKDGDAGYQKRLAVVKGTLETLFGEYSTEVDRMLFVSLMKMYAEEDGNKYLSPLLKEMLSGGDYMKLADRLYAEKIADKKETETLLNKPPAEAVKEISNFQAVKLYNDLLKSYQVNIQPPLNDLQTQLNKHNRSYMQAQMEVFKEKAFYPDANSTLRVTYGNVKGYNPRDAVTYDHYTYLDGVMDKYKPGDYEFDVPEKLRSLYRQKDYGQYGAGGKMPVCFIARNHTTGGNSGSPALDAYGNLIGLNFDRVWEGTMSDINYDPSICRNIMVDIRYVLFIIDKYAGAGHLVSEMKLVHPKRK